MHIASNRPAQPSVRTTLIMDSAFEFVAAGLLLGFAATLGDWLAIGTAACVVLGVVFVAAGVGIAGLVRAPDARAVRALAWANIVGGSVLWAVFFVAWGSLEPEGRFVLGAAADAFIIIGVLELLALRTFAVHGDAG